PAPLPPPRGRVPGSAFPASGIVPLASAAGARVSLAEAARKVSPQCLQRTLRPRWVSGTLALLPQAALGHWMETAIDHLRGRRAKQIPLGAITGCCRRVAICMVRCLLYTADKPRLPPISWPAPWVTMGIVT